MAEPGITVDVKLVEDGNVACLTIIQDGISLAHVTMEGPEFEGFLALLGEVRSRMPDEVPRELEPSGRLASLVDPIWRVIVPTNAPEAGAMVLIRHPGFGWISSLFPTGEAKALGQALINFANISPNKP